MGFCPANSFGQTAPGTSLVVKNDENSIADKDSSQSFAVSEKSNPAKAQKEVSTVANTSESKTQEIANSQKRRGLGHLVQQKGQNSLVSLNAKLIRYGEQHFPVPFRNFYISVIQMASRYPISIFFILLIFIFILNVLFVLLILYLTNQYKNHKERYISLYSGMYENTLQLYLFGETDWNKTRIKLKRIDKPLNRRILINLLFNYQENLRGEMDQKITDIFSKLGLHRDAIKLARSPIYYKKIRGMIELTNLYPEGAKPIVDKTINDSNDLVRSEAQTAYVRLHPDAPFEFLRTLTRPFTKWAQLSAFYLFRLHQLPVPQFADYLKSDHKNVRNFSLRMIIYFQQLENAEAIFNMVSSKTEMTRNLSFRAINDLRLFEGKNLIKEKYPEEPQRNRLEIIKALRNIGNSEDFDFLESILASGTISEKTEACRTMYFMSSESRDRLLQFNRSKNQEFDLYIAHVTEPRN